MTLQRALIRPTGQKVLKIRLRIAPKPIPADAAVEVADVMLQPGSTATGWTPHVTELPWTSGIVGGT